MDADDSSAILPHGIPRWVRLRPVDFDGELRATTFLGREVLVVPPGALTRLAAEAFREIAFFYRPRHLRQVAAILEDPEASANDRTVATALLRNAVVSARGELPMCQDTGTATVIAWKGERVWTGGGDERALAAGVLETYRRENLRYSQVVATSMFEERNSGTNLPAQIDLYATDGDAYEFLFLAKGGGSANKTFLFQETKALLNRKALEAFVEQKMKAIGTAACPPYHLVFVIGGTSAEACLKTVKLATAGALDELPTSGDGTGRAFRDPELEARALEIARSIGIGAQFGGKYFALDVRVVRLPRHGASCPVGMGVSCSADRHAFARIDRNGLWLEELEHDPIRYLPEPLRTRRERDGVPIDLRLPMSEILAELSKHPVGTPLLLSGPMLVARDAAHARWRERIEQGQLLPEYLLAHPIYYAGPAKAPPGRPSGSFGPTTAGRMDGYVELLQSRGASLVMLAKGNRSRIVAESCKRHGGFYLGSIGGPAALLASESIRKVEVLDYPDLGMEAVHRIEVENFPAFILVDDKGNDFFARLSLHVVAD